MCVCVGGVSAKKLQYVYTSRDTSVCETDDLSPVLGMGSVFSGLCVVLTVVN